MCLGIAIARPDDVLAKGEHLGYEWMVIHNKLGYRCGYVKVPNGHPWHGKSYTELDDVSVHGGLTFSEPDEECEKGGPDNAHWLGFDCAHGGDDPDPSLPSVMSFSSAFGPFGFIMEPSDSFCSQPRSVSNGVRTQEYVESECRSLCEQAAKACA